MNQIQINGVDIYNFPTQEKIGHMLFWMGDDYAEFILDMLTTELRKQDPGTIIIAIKCEEEPEFKTNAVKATGAITAMDFSFPVQILAQAGDGRHWRIRGQNTYTATELNTDGKATMALDIHKTELV